MHRHYTYYWHRCRDCGRPAGDNGEYCEDCLAQIEAREATEADATILTEPPPDFDTNPGHDEYGRYTGEFDALDYAQGGDGKVYWPTPEPGDADYVPEAFPCTCRWPYVPSNALAPPEPILDRYCPVHGDGGPDPDRALEERRDQLMEDRLHGYPHSNED